MNSDLYQLVKDKTRIETILDFLPYPFIISEFRFGTYRQIYVNKKFTEELGYTIEEIPTIEEWFELAYPDPTYRALVIADWTQRVEEAKRRGEDAAVLQVIIRTRAGEDKWYEVKASSSGSMQLIAFVCLEDARAKEKELTRLVENKNRTLSILAHDLRVPISNLHSLTELFLRDQLSSSEFRTQATRLHGKSAQVLEFIDTTLYWTKANFDSLQIKSEDVFIEYVVDKILLLYDGTYRAKDLQVLTTLAGDKVRTDSEIVTILLRNVISNAIKFTPDGGRITIHQSKNDNGHRISVRDSGIGMTAAMVKEIEKDNYSSTLGTRDEKGLGIGLKLCHQLAKKINANIEIASEPGKGTEVTLILNN
jgi:signal transduction histidine kinase